MSSVEDSDEALVGRYVRGEAAAFDQLYKRHELRVWRYLERNLRNQATSDELLQEVWFALSRNAVSLESATRFRTRLFTLTHDRMSNSMRQRPPEEAEATGNRPTRDAAGLAQAIGQLPREQREAFLLQAEGQLSVGEIAEITEATIDATQDSLRAAKLQLRDLFGESEAPANPDDFNDIDEMYRRLSGGDAGRPGEWVRRKIQAYSAQQAAERSVRESAKTRERAASVAAAVPVATPRVAPAPAPGAAPAPEPKQSASKPWLLPVIGAAIIVALVAIFVVPSLRAPGVSTVTPPPPPVAPPQVTPPPVAQAPSASESAPLPPSQSAEPEVISSPPPAPAPASTPPAPAQVAQSSEETRASVQPVPAPDTAPSASSASYTQPQPPKAKAIVRQNVAPPPSPPMVAARKPEAQTPVATLPVASAPVQPSPPAAAAETRQTYVAPTPASPPVAAASGHPTPTPVSAPSAGAKSLPPPDDFYRAAETGDMGRLQEVLASNVDVNALDQTGHTALSLAIRRDQIYVVKTLLAHGADVNKVDSHGMTPRAVAHSRGNSKINALIEGAAKH